MSDFFTPTPSPYRARSYNFSDAVYWFGENVVPAVKRAWDGFVREGAALVSEPLDVGLSGTKEVKKAWTYLIPAVLQDLWEFPQEIPLSIIRELGGYTFSGGCAIVKGASLVKRSVEECITLLFGALVRPLAQELCSLGASGLAQSVRSVVTVSLAVGDVFLVSYEAIAPFVCEIASTAASGSIQFAIGARTGWHAAMDAISLLGFFANAVGRESICYISSFTMQAIKTVQIACIIIYTNDLYPILRDAGWHCVQETGHQLESSLLQVGQAALTVGSIISLLRELARFSPLRIALSEGMAYSLSMAHESAKAAKLVPLVIEEPAIALRPLVQTVCLESAAYMASLPVQLAIGAKTTYRATRTIIKEGADGVETVAQESTGYLVSALFQTGNGCVRSGKAIGKVGRELGKVIVTVVSESGLSSGARQMVRGIITTAHAVDDATLIPRECLQTVVCELVADGVSGVVQSVKAVAFTASCITETARLPVEGVITIAREHISYGATGVVQTAIGAKTVAFAIFQTLQVPREPIAQGIDETIEYLVAGSKQVALLQRSAIHGVPEFFYDSIGLPAWERFHTHFSIGQRRHLLREIQKIHDTDQGRYREICPHLPKSYQDELLLPSVMVE
jgi:hypothetical protein